MSSTKSVKRKLIYKNLISFQKRHQIIKMRYAQYTVTIHILAAIKQLNVYNQHYVNST